MYLNIGKLFRRLAMVMAVVILLLGAVTFAFSKTALEQSSGTLAAIFGLMLLWFTIWLDRSRITPASSPKKTQVTPPANDNPRRIQ